MTTISKTSAKGKELLASSEVEETNNLIFLGVGLLSGILGILGYSLFGECKWPIFFVFMFIAAASCISGYFLGFLFGIPKRIDNREVKSDYSLSNNLVDISDWLTKIIIGIGLVEIKNIPGVLQSVGEYVSRNSDCKSQSIVIFTVCTIIYFSVLGLYEGYNYVRLYLSGEYKKADSNLLSTLVDTVNSGNSAQNVEEVKTVLHEQENLGKFSEGGSGILTFNEFSTLLDKAKQKMAMGKLENPNDPQKNQWGGKYEVNGKKITAFVTPFGNSGHLYRIILNVISTDEENPLPDGLTVLFGLHDTFRDPFKIVTVLNGKATLKLVSRGSFTVGAFVGNDTELELDLASLPDIPKEFKDR